jgi:hypothetical protein
LDHLSLIRNGSHLGPNAEETAIAILKDQQFLDDREHEPKHYRWTPFGARPRTMHSTGTAGLKPSKAGYAPLNRRMGLFMSMQQTHWRAAK